MHEMSLAEGIVRILEEQAMVQDFTRVQLVRLEIGELSQVDQEALSFSFSACILDTIAEGTRLEIVTVPGTAWCMKCGGPVTIHSREEACPDCGSYQLQVTGGDEMRVLELEVE